MARTLLAANQWNVGTPLLADPANVNAAVGGNNAQNTGAMMLRVLNSASNANAVATLIMTGTVSGGAFDIYIKIFDTTYKAAGVAWDVSNANLNLAVLGAVQPNGNTLATDFPAGTAVVGSGPLATGTNATLTFAGAGVGPATAYPVAGGGGLANTPVEVTVDGTSLTGSGHTIAAVVTTAGTGNGLVVVETPAGGAPYGSYAFRKFYVPGNSAVTWLGPFNEQVFNQSDHSIYIDWDNYANYTVAAFNMKNS